MNEQNLVMLWRVLDALRYNRAMNQAERDAMTIPALEVLEAELAPLGYSVFDGLLLLPVGLAAAAEGPEPEPVPAAIVAPTMRDPVRPAMVAPKAAAPKPADVVFTEKPPVRHTEPPTPPRKAPEKGAVAPHASHEPKKPNQ